MKIFKSLLTIFIIAAVIIAMIITRPTKADFTEYYVNQQQTGLGTFFDAAYEKVVMQKTEESDYLVFSVFEVNGEDRYVGILGHFFGSSSIEQATQTMDNLIDQAKQMLDNY